MRARIQSKPLTDAELQRQCDYWLTIQRGAARKVSALTKQIDERKKRREAGGK